MRLTPLTFTFFVFAITFTFSTTCFAEENQKGGEDKSAKAIAPSTLGPGLSLNDVLWIHITTIAAFVICTCVGIVAFRNQAQLLQGALRNTDWILRVATVLFVIWATTALAALNRLDQGVAAIFGAVIGYVFGTIKTPRRKGTGAAQTQANSSRHSP